VAILRNFRNKTCNPQLRQQWTFSRSIVYSPDGEPFAMITVNIDYPLSGDKETTAFIDTNNLNAFLIERFLQENQIATPTGEYGQSGFCTYPEYRFDLSKF